MLVLEGLTKRFGGVRALDGLDLAIHEGEIVGLIGPNGSGKSTAVNLVTGLLPVTAGRILFRGRDITGLAPHQVAVSGIARTFQNIRLFGHLPVWQNVWVAQNSREDRRRRFLGRWLSRDAEGRRRVEEILDFCGLAHRRDDLARGLSFGEQRRLELARALAASPVLLLLDEPAAGMNTSEIGELRERLLSLRRRGLTILLIEHVMELVMGIADRVAVLNFGRKIAEGTPAAIQEDPRVREAYLGRTGTI
jgi:branched-chain amino acid transport system ATP-binding protein